MTPPPSTLDGARVLRYAIIDDAAVPTGNTLHRLGAMVVGPAAALAVGQYEPGEGFYLFSCDGEWRVVTDRSQ